MRLMQLRHEVAAAARTLAARGLAGNAAASLSARDPRTGWWLVTAEGADMAAIDPRALILVSAAGVVLQGTQTPSSDRDVHLRVYAGQTAARALVVARPERAAMLAAQSRGIPPFHRRLGRLGGGVRCLPYAPAGSDALARLVAQALGTRSACLVTQQGAVARGATPAEAVFHLALVDRLAGAYAALVATGESPRMVGGLRAALPREDTDRTGG